MSGQSWGSIFDPVAFFTLFPCIFHCPMKYRNCWKKPGDIVKVYEKISGRYTTMKMKHAVSLLSAFFIASALAAPVNAAEADLWTADAVISDRAGDVNPAITPVAELPEEYIREAMSGPYATGVYVEVLQSVESVPADILDLVSENGGILSVAVYENAADKYPLYIWGIRGGYSSGKEADFKLKVSVDVPEIKQGAAGVIGDGSVAFATVSMAHAGELPENTELSVPIPDAEKYGIWNVYFYDHDRGRITDRIGFALNTDTDYDGWCTIRNLSAGVEAGDYILTPADLDYDTKIYSDISEAEERIKRDLRSDEQAVNIRMGYYHGNEYKLSAETLNAVRESGKDLHITFPGVEASATYMWTFHGSEMGEVTAPVDLIVRFPVSGDVVEAVNGKITNDAGTLMLDFQHSGPLPSGTDFSTLAFAFDNVDLSQNGYYYYYDEGAGTLQCSGKAQWYMAVNPSNPYGESLFVRLEDMAHCSYYVVTDKLAEGPDVDNTIPERPDPEKPAEPGQEDPQDPAGPSGGDGNDTELTGGDRAGGDSAVNAGTPSPKTGDGSEMPLILYSIALSGAAAGILVLRKRCVR